MQIGVLCSGDLGYNILNKLFEEYSIPFVFCDSNSNKIIEFCLDNSISFFQGNPRDKKSFEFLKNKSCDILLSVNYLFLIEEDLIKFPRKYAINVHGSLLPKYRGRTPHVWAIINNEKKTGITAHLIDNGCDTGAIIEQLEIPIQSTDTGASLLYKFNELYWPLISNVLTKAKYGELDLKNQDNNLASFFGKRNPEDGLINWDWQKERIYNWVRALTFPYPGAFTTLNGRKITIDAVSFSNYGFDYSTPNGTILSGNPLKVKTPNGVIQIDSIREDLGTLDEINFKNSILRCK